jgi:aryl-alcohol dehydrogenase-like predicted oxidoreductase
MLDHSFYRPLGRTGLYVSPICLGCDNFANPTSAEESSSIINCAIENGINLIDTANGYANGQSEEIIGRCLKENGRRDDVILATKAYYPVGNKGINDRGNSRKHLFKACEDSLRRLQTDYIDLYQTHRVCMQTPLEETLGALTDLQRQGKIRYAGSTTSPSWKITESSMLADYRGLIRMVSEQLPYNLLDRRVENEILPAARAAGLAVFVWSPLAMGLLTGRYDSSKPESFIVLHELAHAYHYQVLGFDNALIKTAFERARNCGSYEAVLRFDGKKEKAYALTNPQEYFAESTEAYFGRNDFFPFDREELQQHDPAMVKVLQEVWQVEPDASNAVNVK